MSNIGIKEGYKLEIFQLGPLGTNCYVLVDKKDGSAAIIDPGYNDVNFIKTIKEQNITPKMILLTHGHFDHIGGLEAFPDVPVYIHSLDKEMLADGQKNLSSMFFSSVEYEPKNIITFEDSFEIKFNDDVFKVIHTPGHSKGSSMFLFPCRVLFAGDAVFKGSVGRYDGFGASESATKQTIKKLSNLEGDYLIYPGHGEETTLNEERLTNPYFKEW